MNFKLGWPAHELGVGCHDFDFFDLRDREESLSFGHLV